MGHPASLAPPVGPVCSFRGTRSRLSMQHSRCSMSPYVARYERSGDMLYAFPDDGRWALTWEWLLQLRRAGGLPGHAEMGSRTLFIKFNTGPSGHGIAPAAGEALALKLAGAETVKVFLLEGEGGLSAGASHETKNTAWGLGLLNLVFLIDWNDFGIDPRPMSAVANGSPADWFVPYGWRVTGTERGSESGRLPGRSSKAHVVITPINSPQWPGSGQQKVVATASTITKATGRLGRLILSSSGSSAGSSCLGMTLHTTAWKGPLPQILPNYRIRHLAI